MKKTMTRAGSTLLVLLFLVCLTVLPVFAATGDGEYYSIDVDVTLLEDGSAAVTEVWDVELDDDWSELYVPKTNLGDMEISDMSVTDLTTGKPFTYVGEDWDVGSGLSTEDKRALKYERCGIAPRDDGGIELCWGVSGEGRKQYQLSYRMSNVVQAYTDGYDGFLIRFINANLSPAPDHVSVSIGTQGVTPLTHENTKFWAFGLMGTTKLEDGRVIVESDEGGLVAYCNVMLRFDGGMFAPSVETGRTFYSLAETAFQGSDYDLDAYDAGTSGGDSATSETDVEKPSAFERVFDKFSDLFDLLIVPFLVIVFALIGVSRGASRSSGSKTIKRVNDHITKQEKKDILYSRDLPFHNDLPETYLALDAMKELPTSGAIIEAYLLRWMKNGWARVEEKPKKRLNGLLSDKMEPSIVFTNTDGESVTETMSPAEASLWDLLHQAAGKDEILQEDELEKYAKRYYEKLDDFFEDTLNEGLATAKDSGYVEELEGKTLGIFKKRETVLSEEGKKQFLNVLAFRKFLKEFTIINEREARDVGLWGDYLTYAALFGIADEVAEQFKELVPDFFTNPQAYGYYGAGWDTYDTIWMIHMMNRFSNTAYNSYMSGRSAAEISTASSGGGGYTSFGGGGGFSGGGIGGGGR